MDTGIWTPIGQKLRKLIGGERSAVLQWLKTATATDFASFASFAPLVIESAQQQCSASQAILLEAKQEVDKLVTKCCADNELPIVFLGSLGQYYQTHLASEWQQRRIEPRGDALDGGILLALQQVEKIYE